MSGFFNDDHGKTREGHNAFGANHAAGDDYGQARVEPGFRRPTITRSHESMTHAERHGGHQASYAEAFDPQYEGHEDSHAYHGQQHDAYDPHHNREWADHGAHLHQPEGPPRWSEFGGLMNGIAALASVALLVGAGLWGAELVMRDAQGVPVVRALEGPMREAPADPGGQLADNIGLAVNSVAAYGNAAAPADQLALAPPPVALTDDDQPQATLPTPVAQAPIAQTPVTPTPAADDRFASATISVIDSDTAAPLPQVTSIQPTDQSTGTARAPSLSNMADQIGNGTFQSVSVTSPSAFETGSDSVLTVPTIAVPASAPVVAIMKPRLRPRGLRLPTGGQGGAEVQIASTDLDAVIRATLDPAPAQTTAPTGELAQLGAVDTREQADREWVRLRAILGDELTNRQAITQEASRGGRQFYRLRVAGFADKSAVRRFCAAVQSRGSDCIVVP